MGHHIVLGMGYGDEGKGVFTDYLSSQLDAPVVIRFNGGHQCGHTVRNVDGRLHVFSNFGAGTFRQVPVFFSRFCTIDPTGIVREFHALRQSGISPQLFVDPMAVVTTPFDKFYNVNDPANLSHGTVGVGFGATVERSQGPYKLFAQDLLFPDLFCRKLEAIREYYRVKLKARGVEGCMAALEYETVQTDRYLNESVAATEIIRLVNERELFSMGFHNYIFEGGQGILLDMDFGFFPNVTRSNTTSRNAFEILRRNYIDPDATIHYLTRAYQTRHGNGWMSAENHPVRLVNNEHETNKSAGHQGNFRTGILDLDMLRYALQCDANSAGNARKQMVVSCLDQLTAFQYLSNGHVHTTADRNAFLEQIALCDTVLINESPGSETITQWR